MQEGLRKVGDLTLRDKSDYVLWEFSEEHPPVMSGFGMGSVLVNYYRKKTDDDDYIPKVRCQFASPSFLSGALMNVFSSARARRTVRSGP